MLPPQVLCALARYYGVSVDYLLGETDVRALSGGEKAVRDGSAPFKPSPRGEGSARSYHSHKKRTSDAKKRG